MENFKIWYALQNENLQAIIVLAGIFLAILIFDRIIKHLLKNFLAKLAGDRTTWIYFFLRDEKFIFWVLSLPYITIISQGLNWLPQMPDTAAATNILQRIIITFYVLLGLFILSNFLRVVNEIYTRTAISRQRPIKGYLQTLLLISYFIGLISILAIVLNKSPVILLSGLGAITAILLLVFKDTILSFVAGVQLTTNDLIRVGDWVEMPQFNADGDVVDIALHTVKIQNWDRTITVIPAHKFLEHSFKNWRGMHDSGGRRIKRSLYIDLTTIGFLGEEDIERLSKIKVLQDYLNGKRNEISNYNRQFEDDRIHSNQVNLRRLTNIGTFRAYITNYLRNHPMIHQNMTFLIRQLAPDAQGLPIEIYVFTNDTRWPAYEGIQADIFDHLLAILPEFKLRAFQHPSGYDMRSLTTTKN